MSLTIQMCYVGHSKPLMIDLTATVLMAIVSSSQTGALNMQPLSEIPKIQRFQGFLVAKINGS